jgi:hypothetical protein
LKHEPIPGTFIIGIGHKARHGKDTAANHIIKATNGAAERYSFADDLYSVARVIHGMTKKDGPLLQLLGTEVYRRYNDNIWIDSLYWKLLDKRPRIALIADVRFPNEAKFVKALGGALVKVSRFNEDDTPFVTTDRDPNHPSEVALDNFDGWDYNIKSYTGQLPTLLLNVDNLLWDLRDRIGTDF